tara:strand:+ start:2103 stop:2615 length:513 start_codon:yes stop_codon:yes gene_type:complete
MGMDVYGNNPTIHKSKDEFPLYAKYEDVPWGDREKDPEWEKVKDAYWEEYNAYEKANPGVYFRNNCWWWRPLWNYCYFISRHYNLNLIDEELFQSGHANDGAGLDAEGSMTLAMHLQMSIEDGTAENYDSEYKEEMEASDDEFAKSYPFDIRNVADFAEFLEYSGGFSIN